jgi:hypothetical protein
MHKRPPHGESDDSTTDSLNTWIADLTTALGINPTGLDRELVLEVSRATHRVARTAAPLTIFFIGLAAGMNGGGPEAISQAATTAQHLATERLSSGN